MTHVKICGITTAEAGIAAADAGADAVGFVFADSPRRVTGEQAAAIASELPRVVDRYAVFLRPEPGEVAAVLEVFPADVVQADNQFLDLHVSARLLPVFREGVDSEDSIRRFLATAPDRRFLYEGPRSGAGVQVDLSVAAGLARDSRMTLAGGLSPENVAAALGAVRPYGVDVSSGVESAPGIKDPDLIKRFVETVRDNDER